METTTLERSYLRSDLPEIRPGDTVRVRQKIKEGSKDRIASFEGTVIARKHGVGLSATFTVRRVIDGIGVERIFPLHLPSIVGIEVLRHSKVRRAKLYYIRDRAAREIRKKMKQVWREDVPLSEPAPDGAPAEEARDAVAAE